MAPKTKTTEDFIIDAYCMHGSTYNYKLVEYNHCHDKIKIVCKVHGIFEQIATNHLRYGCIRCSNNNVNNPSWKGGVVKRNISLYDTFQSQLEPYGILCRRNKEDSNILEIKCMYCDKWYQPSRTSIKSKIRSINTGVSENNLYCSDECKQSCPTYRQIKYPKGFKKNTSREVQPSLRKLVLKRDDWTCQKCDSTENGLHCHHYEGVEVNPIESADIDNCITLCKKCHNKTHTKDKCGTNQYKRGRC